MPTKTDALNAIAALYEQDIADAQSAVTALGPKHAGDLAAAQAAVATAQAALNALPAQQATDLAAAQEIVNKIANDKTAMLSYLTANVPDDPAAVAAATGPVAADPSPAAAA